MKTIKIAHLYYDLMNLYGESGNITALVNALTKQKVKSNVVYLTINDKINFDDYDIFYIGMGTENNQELVRKDILQYKKQIEKAIKEKVFISTGNSIELFGKKLNNLDCLGTFNYSAHSIEKRIVGEQFLKTYFMKDIVIGFQNRGSVIENDSEHLFEIIKGIGDNQESKFEGYHINEFYGTYTIGPLLIRNPILTDLIVEKLLNKLNIPYKAITNTVDYKAYKEFLKNFPIEDSI